MKSLFVYRITAADIRTPAHVIAPGKMNSHKVKKILIILENLIFPNIIKVGKPYFYV